MRERKRWHDLDGPERATIIVAAGVQVMLAAGAWWDLAHRPAERVRGPKWLWALVIAVNFVGPILYFSCGRAGPRENRPANSDTGGVTAATSVRFG
ncbi:PLD nuclease N-terminal domain-containing protein [Amycolatopsis sp. CA-161197]|uniref:PLD nuclease N-terminal domain-containing protein n=1 Tax=Amycolatopsis sp. CA-161197 TaxID=3239922 RepID=UPI003D91D8A9